MESIWLNVWKQSISVSIVILAVLLVRGIFMRKLPKKYAFFLWAVVGFRLLIPVEVTSSVNMFQIVSDTIEQLSEKYADDDEFFLERVRLETLQNPEEKESSSIEDKQSKNTEIKEKNAIEKSGTSSENSNQIIKQQKSKKQYIKKVILQVKQLLGNKKFIQITACVWICGMFIFWSWNLLAWLKMKKCLQYAVRYQDHIYECDKIGSPFVMGLVHPKIYIPFRLGEKEQSYILKHEQYHIQRKDYLTKFVACVLMGVYWFHPLVWMAYFYMVRDMEMSCDEYVVQTMGDEIKKEYSASLLAFATNSRHGSMGMLAFGESGTRKRIKHILQSKKPAKWVGVIAVVLVLVTGSVCFAASDVVEPLKDDLEVMLQEKDTSADQDKKKIKPEKEDEEIKVETESNIFYVKSDITGDGIEDKIKINWSFDVLFPTEKEVNVVEVVSGATGKVIYSMGNDEINTVHVGYNSVYLYHGKKQDYLLNWNPYMGQNHGTYQYEIFYVDDQGKKYKIEKEGIGFYTLDMNESDIQEYETFMKKVNKRLKKSDILISTLDGEVVTYQDLEDHRLIFDTSADLEEMREAE